MSVFSNEKFYGALGESNAYGEKTRLYVCQLSGKNTLLFSSISFFCSRAMERKQILFSETISFFFFWKMTVCFDAWPECMVQSAFFSPCFVFFRGHFSKIRGNDCVQLTRAMTVKPWKSKLRTSWDYGKPRPTSSFTVKKITCISCMKKNEIL